MSVEADNFCMKELITEFLSGSITEMPRLEARVVSRNPTRITEDERHFFEISSLDEAIVRQAEEQGIASDASLRIVLNDWNLVLNLSGQTPREQLNVAVENFRLEVQPKGKKTAAVKENWLDEPQIRNLLDSKKRAYDEAESRGRRHQTSGNSQAQDKLKVNAFGNPVDDEIGLSDILTSKHNPNAPNMLTPSATVNQVKKSVTRSPSKFEAPLIPEKLASEPDHLVALRVAEANADVLGKRSLDLLENVPPESRFGEGSEKRKVVKMTDLWEGFRKGKLSWDQVVFSRETVEYLQKNIHTLLADN